MLYLQHINFLVLLPGLIYHCYRYKVKKQPVYYIVLFKFCWPTGYFFPMNYFNAVYHTIQTINELNYLCYFFNVYRGSMRFTPPNLQASPSEE